MARPADGVVDVVAAGLPLLNQCFGASKAIDGAGQVALVSERLPQVDPGRRQVAVDGQGGAVRPCRGAKAASFVQAAGEAEAKRRVIGMGADEAVIQIDGFVQAPIVE